MKRYHLCGLNSLRAYCVCPQMLKSIKDRGAPFCRTQSYHTTPEYISYGNSYFRRNFHKMGTLYWTYCILLLVCYFPVFCWCSFFHILVSSGPLPGWQLYTPPPFPTKSSIINLSHACVRLMIKNDREVRTEHIIFNFSDKGLFHCERCCQLHGTHSMLQT